MQQRPHWIRGIIGIGLLLGCLMVTEIAAAQSVQSLPGTSLAPGTIRLTVTDGHLSLEAEEASVVTIFAEIGQQTGIEMEIHLGTEETITTHFDHVPLQDALKRLAKNVAMLSAQAPDAPTHRITKVYVYPEGQEGALPLSKGNIPYKTATTRRDASRPQPFQFTLDPSQYMKKRQ